MARMIAEVYDALRSAGADEDKARAAATAVAGPSEIEPRLDQIDGRFDKVEGQLDQIDNRIDKVERRLDQIDNRIDKVEGRLDRLEVRFDRLEQRVNKLETDVGILKWMVGFSLAFQVATLFFIWQLMLRMPT